MTSKNRFNPLTVGTRVEDISPQDAIRRFKQLHQLRLKRIQQLVQPTQQIFLDLLALLFHQNIALLPGYSSPEVPCGIANYVPAPQTLKVAKKFSNSFSYRNVKLQQYAIDAIFLMGSVSSIAFSESSDMDIWVCHQSSLKVEQLAALQGKADSIEKWSASLGLEVHFFLIDSEQFLHGQTTPISTESSGQMQHYLLLEEFYRTAIYVAGKVPAWWLIPPHEDNNYSAYLEHLRSNRFIKEQDIIDLGGLEAVPPEEFTSATFWHLYKALYAPQKSLLKLLLMECYASEYPHSDWLCLHLKQAIYEGIVDIDELDPYLLIYRKIDHYLHEHPKRLTFARQCFYLKVMGPGLANQHQSSKQKITPAQALRQAFIQKVAEQWQWPEYLIPELINNKLWTISKANWEYEIIQDQLQQSYRIIQGFTKKNTQNISHNNDVELIRRKLRSFLSPKPGKVDIISTKSSVRIGEVEISLLESVTPYGDSSWLLYSGKVSELSQIDYEPIKRTGSYMEALVWLVVNGVYHKQLLLNIEAQSVTLMPQELKRICEHIFQLLNNQVEDASHELETYRSSDVCLLSLAFVNLGTAEIIDRQDGKVVISQQSDALCYGANQQCLIQRIDSVKVSRWGEITINRYLGLEGLFDYLTETFNNLAKPFQPRQLQFACYTPVRGNSILHRLNKLVNQLCHVFAHTTQPEVSRYYLAGSRAYFCIQRLNNAFTYWEIPAKTQLFKELGNPQPYYCNAVFDPDIHLKSVIPSLYTYNQPETIQIFFIRNAKYVNIYLLDEKGALFMQQHPQANTEQVLNSYSTFLDAVINHYFSDRAIAVDYYEIHHSASQGLVYTAIELKPLSPYQKLDIRISAVRNEDKTVRYSIYCNEQVFSSLDYGKAVFNHAASHIMQCRRANEHYPIHISDVDVPLAILGVTSLAQLQSIHLLQFKQKIESRLIA